MRLSATSEPTSKLPTFYKVRKWDLVEEKEVEVGVTVENIVYHPQGLNMIDVSVILLNYLRESEGLEIIPESQISRDYQDKGVK